jgi:3'(2'), 5'-bisphosphate nucleotidase
MDLLLQGTRLPDREVNEKFTVVCSRSHMSAETEAYIDELRQAYGEVDYASRGSSLKLCMVAEGEADVYPRFAPTMEWDTAAGQAIAECSGAIVVDAAHGERLQYNKENLLNPWFIVSR